MKEKNSPKLVAIVVCGIIMLGFIEPLIIDGGPVLQWLLIDDCGISSVDDVCDILDGPKFPYGLGLGV